MNYVMKPSLTIYYKYCNGHRIAQNPSAETIRQPRSSTSFAHFTTPMARKKSSINIKVTRPAEASKVVPLARIFRLHRLSNGHISSSKTHQSGVVDTLDRPAPNIQNSIPLATEEYYDERHEELAAAATDGDLEEGQLEGSKVYLIYSIILECTSNMLSLTVTYSKSNCTMAPVQTIVS